MRMVLGVDAGGTSSRAALFTVEGALVRRGSAGGANPGALGRDLAAANLTAAVRDALVEAPPVQVVVGMAGNPEACAALADQVFREVLPGVPVASVGDLVTAFAAGTAAASGSVLISGTGAIAAKIIGHRAVAVADGFGWQLGDEGSAFWLGRAAARATIRALAAGASGGGTPSVLAAAASGGGTPPALVAGGGVAPGGGLAGDGLAGGELAGGGMAGGELARLVVRCLAPEGLGGDPVAELAAAVYARPPLALAELAPLVSRAAAEGDPVAVGIVREAAARLVATLRGVHDAGPVVLAGSVLTSEGPVRQAVTELLSNKAAPTAGDTVTAPSTAGGGMVGGGMAGGGMVVATAGDTAGAAAWLAARPFLSSHDSRARHRLFVRAAR
ncbi:N-acetylglucosamine kinase [Nonomuraea sp. PA05]|uniref:N-acetylglucosamine kinase n=1 Tax=Nonomuraea sp. PA05 TaxID=2604466 RepID=UPI0016522CC1|nr:BadF/BadG/BcrA/BcrD ATPase family protein [Nonomuraea sp. PA05]